MAAPTFRAAGIKSAAVGAISVAAPAGVATGDLEILIATTIAGGSISITTAGGSAWTAVPSTPIDVTGGEKLYAWYRIRQAGDSDPTVTPGSDHVCAGRLAYTAGTFDTITVVSLTATGTEVTNDSTFSFAPGNSTAVVDSLVLCIATNGADSNTGQVPVMTNANLTGLTSRINFQTTSGGGGGFGVTEGVRAAPGAIGTFACTMGTNSPKAYMVFALIPVQPVVYTDSGTPRLTLTPSGSEFPAKEYLETNTERVSLTASSTEEYIPPITYTDGVTVSLLLTPGGADTADYVLAGEAVEILTISGEDLNLPIDHLVAELALQPIGQDVSEIVEEGVTPILLVVEGEDATDYIETEGQVTFVLLVTGEDVTEYMESVEVLVNQLEISAEEVGDFVETEGQVTFVLLVSGEDATESVEAVENVLFLLAVSATDVFDAVEAVESVEFPLNIEAEEHDPYFDADEVHLYLTPSAGPGIGLNVVSDNFNRANGALGTGWTPFAVDGGMSIVSNEVTPGANAHLGNYRNAEIYTNDQYAEVEVTSTPLAAGDFIGAIVRAKNNGADFYAAFYAALVSDGGVGSEFLYLYKRVGGVFSFCAGPVDTKLQVGTLSPGDKIRVTARGNVIQAYINGVLKLSSLDTSHLSGAPGVFGWGFSHLDNYVGGDIITEIVTDDFNRADSQVDNITRTWARHTAYSSSGWPAIVSNRIVGEAAHTAGAAWAAGTFGADQASQITGISNPSGAWFGVTVRDTPATDSHYLAIYYASGVPVIHLYKRVAGTYTQLGSEYVIPGGVISSNDVLRIEAIGSTITAKLNGVSVISVTDTSIPSGGTPGFASFGASSADNWQGENLGGETAQLVDTTTVRLALTPSSADVEEFIEGLVFPFFEYRRTDVDTDGNYFVQSQTVTMVAGTLPFYFLTVRGNSLTPTDINDLGRNLGWTIVSKAVFNSGADACYLIVANSPMPTTTGISLIVSLGSGQTTTQMILSTCSVRNAQKFGAAAFRGVGKTENDNGANPPSAALPANAEEYNTIVEFIASNGSGGISPPTGWTTNFQNSFAAAGTSHLSNIARGFGGTTPNWTDHMGNSLAQGVIIAELDLAPVYAITLTLTPSTPQEGIERTDTGTVNFRLTPSAVEVAEFAETDTENFVLAPSTVADESIFTETGELRLLLVPSAIEVFVRPGEAFEGMQLIARIRQNYGYSGHILNKTGRIGSSSGYVGRTR